MVKYQLGDSTVMLVTNAFQDSPAGGRELLSKLNYDALKEVIGDRLVVLELARSRLRGFAAIFKAFRGCIDGLTDSVFQEALQTIRAKNVTAIFINGSNLGELAKRVKRQFPQVEVTTFFHNVEARFFLGSLKQAKTARAAAVLITNYLAERKAVRASDKLICLSERDSRLLGRLYGRTATHISPIALHDNLPPDYDSPRSAPAEKYALFVGGTFYANRAGITWFVRHVSPWIRIKTCIVGRGFEGFASELERDGGVKVIGAVDDLGEWYRNAHFVIAPIFDGSGMKTKVAEALMHGKKIIGTPEAFAGYEDVSHESGWICRTAEDFIHAINQATSSIVDLYDPGMRALYLQKYSFPAARLRLERILNS